MTLPKLERLEVLADTGTKTVFMAIFDAGFRRYKRDFELYHRGGWSERAEDEAKLLLAEAVASAHIEEHFALNPECRNGAPSVDAAEVAVLLDRARSLQPSWFRGCRMIRSK